MGDILILILVGSSYVAAILFPIVYATTARWYETVIGRALMYQSVAIAAILTLVVLTLVFGPEFPGRVGLRYVVYGLISTMLWNQLISYVITYRRIRRNKDAERPGDLH